MKHLPYAPKRWLFCLWLAFTSNAQSDPLEKNHPANLTMLKTREQQLIERLQRVTNQIASARLKIDGTTKKLADGHRKLKASRAEQKKLVIKVNDMKTLVSKRLKARHLSKRRGSSLLRLALNERGLVEYLTARSVLREIARQDSQLLSKYNALMARLDEQIQRALKEEIKLKTTEGKLRTQVEKLQEFSQAKLKILNETKIAKRAFEASTGGTQLTSYSTALRYARELNWYPPMNGKRIRSFGLYRSQEHGTHHHFPGWRYRANQPMEVRAAAEGKVIFSGFVAKYGQVVLVEHAPAVHTVYAGISKVLVTAGTKLKAKEILGWLIPDQHPAQPTALHFEVRIRKNSVNPMQFVR